MGLGRGETAFTMAEACRMCLPLRASPTPHRTQCRRFVDFIAIVLWTRKTRNYRELFKRSAYNKTLL